MTGRTVPPQADRQDWPRLVSQTVNKLNTRVTMLETIKVYTVATLPTAGTVGRRAVVSDATAPTFLGALTGGGTVKCPVFDNGAAWVAG